MASAPPTFTPVMTCNIFAQKHSPGRVRAVPSSIASDGYRRARDAFGQPNSSRTICMLQALRDHAGNFG